MLVSELLKKTNQSLIADTKTKEDAPRVENLMKRFTELSTQAQVTGKARNAKIESQLSSIEKDLQIYANDDTYDKLNKQADLLRVNAHDVVEVDEKVDGSVRECLKQTFDNFASHIDDLRHESKDIVGGFNKESEKQLLRAIGASFVESMLTVRVKDNDSFNFFRNSSNFDSTDRFNFRH